METTQATAKQLLGLASLSAQDRVRLEQLGYFPLSAPRALLDDYPAEDDNFWEPAYPDEPHPHTPPTRRKHAQKYRRKDGERSLEHALERVFASSPAHTPTPLPARTQELVERWRSVQIIRQLREIDGEQAAHHAWHAVISARDAHELSGHVWVLRRAPIAKAYNLYRAHLAQARELFELNHREHQRLLRGAARAQAPDAEPLLWSLKLWHAAAQYERPNLAFTPAPLKAWGKQPDELMWLDAWYDLYFLAPHTLKHTLFNYLHAQQRAATTLAPPPAPMTMPSPWGALVRTIRSRAQPAQTRLMWPIAVTFGLQ